MKFFKLNAASRAVLMSSVVLLLTFSCTTTRKPYYSNDVMNWKSADPAASGELIYSIFLVGDAGAPSDEEPPLLLLKSHLEQAGPNSAVVYLGDNIYHHGLPKPGAYDRKIAEGRMNNQLNILRNYKGEKYMIPGNHDWENGGPDGYNAALREEFYVEAYLADTNIVEGGNFFIPDDGCPGPFEAILFDNVVMIALNTQWWLHPYEKPYGENNYCGVANEVDMLVQLEDIIRKHQGKDIVVVGHHPLFSNGVHGGWFTFTDHIFPVAIVRDWAYLPLPIIGSMYPLARKYGGISQDIPHPSYQALKKGLLGIFEKYDNITYAAGHEHNLQYFKHKGQPHIISGSGCKTQHVRGGLDAVFNHREKGFARINYYANGDAWVEFWEPTGKEGTPGEIIFREKMYTRQPKKADEFADMDFSSKYDTTGALIIEEGEFAGKSTTVAANERYKAGGFKKLFLGEHYRPEWATPIEVPLLDMQSEQGGLTPYKKGGGKQTASLKVRDPEGREFTLRSINKDPSLVLPADLRETFAKDILQDQISAQHPYGAFVVPPLADAVGVYHTNPKLVYIPDDPRLRHYREEFANTLAMFEEDADENHENVRSLGFATNLVGTDKVMEKLQKDNDNRVDEQMFARARLFDMLLGDWDRHKGQWRWAEQEKEKGAVYEPVPEDRDQVFFKADGLLPWLATRKWSIRNFQNFGYDYGDYVGLNLSALNNDRAFLSSVSREDWIRIANDMKASLTDEVIEQTIRQWPDQIYAKSGPEIVAKLKARRDLLPQVAENYYEHLSEVVDVRGSDKHERIEINRLNNEQTEVTVYKQTKEGEIREQIYHRIFYTKETDEIRVYAFGGQDEIYVTGDVGKGIKIRIIGGDGEDLISDKSRVSSLCKKTLVYDTKDENKFDFGPETKDKTSEYYEVNLYDPDAHRLPYMGPRLSAEYNVDDGIFLGAGLVRRTYGFRKEPFATEQVLMGNYAFKTSSYNIRYSGTFTEALGKWDVNLQGSIAGPQFLFNFYGLGNQTEQVRDVEFYRVRYRRQTAAIMLQKDLATFVKIGIGPFFDNFKVENREE
ncbi:MAG: metallophosphoesterase, partial [Hymenobacteraceae bacterium]|nr:metallophosphoesterase [Hymenobacteraceae bacterium]MDX5395335.1 metallophosphoesterase [Hymenobacteraceae bacterium]MDX5511386.1 metallophosphoesterase [Hymenobacteraceae bacterium]